MSWLRVDDGMVENTKISPLSDAAFRAMIELWSYASRNLSDGFVPTREARRIAGQRCLMQLVAQGLFIVEDGGWRANDWHDHNPTAREIKDKRAAEAARLKSIRARGKS